MKTRELKDLLFIPVTTWKQIAERMVNSIRFHVQKKKYFSNRPYKPEYAELKSENRALTGGATQASRSTIPDLTLTGKMLGDLRVLKVDDESCTIGWSGFNAQKVIENAKRNRAITTKDEPLIPPVLKEVLADIDKAFGKSINSYRRVTNIKLQL